MSALPHNTERDALNPASGPDELLRPERLAKLGSIARVEYYPSIGSTQDRAQEVGRAQICGALPLLVVAEEQTAGRGRGTNRWWTGRGSLAFSLLFDPADWSLSRELQPRRSLVIGAAIVETLRPLVNDPLVGLHWPNDVFAGSQKLAGVLIDILPGGRHVVGIGLNVNNTFAAAPDDVRIRGTSLIELIGRQFDRTELLAELLSRLETSLRAEGSGVISFQEMCLQIGRQLTIDVGGCRSSGRCAGIGADGALLLETDSVVRRFYSGTLV